MREVLWAVALLFGAGHALPGQHSPAAPQVYLATVGVGEGIDARFGHNAIWVRDSLAGTDLLYNYGTFDYGDPLFVPHFVQGRPLYWLSTSPMDAAVAHYRDQKRSLVLQELNLPDLQRAELAFLLAQNALAANRDYRYDYYLDNCSTRVRDMLNQVLGGALRRATEGKAAMGTLRFHTQRSVAYSPFFYFGIMALMGPVTDRPLNQWDEMFLPEMVQERVRELRVSGPTGGEVPLVKEERTVLAMDSYRSDPTPPAWGGSALLVGVLLGALMLGGRRLGVLGRIGRWVTMVWLLLVGVGGLLLLYVWFATDHVAAANNRNTLLLSPLALVLLGQVGSGAAHQSRWRRGLGYAFLGSLAVGTLLAMVPAVGLQWNLQLAALVVPPSLAAWAVTTRPRAGAPSPLP